MKDVNQITICKDQYNSKVEFENAIKDAVMVLLNNDYIMTVQYDDKGLGIVVIDYNYDKQEYGCDYPYWLSLDEFESIPVESESQDCEVERRGEWVLLDECSNEGVYCSVCNKKVYRKEYANQKVKSNYCPNCGSKMTDGGKI